MNVIGIMNGFVVTNVLDLWVRVSVEMTHLSIATLATTLAATLNRALKTLKILTSSKALKVLDQASYILTSVLMHYSYFHASACALA